MTVSGVRTSWEKASIIAGIAAGDFRGPTVVVAGCRCALRSASHRCSYQTSFPRSKTIRDSTAMLYRKITPYIAMSKGTLTVLRFTMSKVRRSRQSNVGNGFAGMPVFHLYQSGRTPSPSPYPDRREENLEGMRRFL